jgi:hypothetical protein
MHFEIFLDLRAGANREKRPTKHKPRATSFWSHGGWNKFDRRRNYFGCSFKDAELMQ